MRNLLPSAHEHTRRDFLSLAGKGLGLAALSSATIASLLKEVEAATKSVAHLTAEQAAMDEDYWSAIQNSFTVTRGIVNLNNGGVSPSPRLVTEALVRYIWQQEDATAYTMWQILEPQSETIRTGLAEMFGCEGWNCGVAGRGRIPGAGEAAALATDSAGIIAPAMISRLAMAR